MEELGHMGKVLVVIGLIIAAIGLILTFSDKVPFLGKLPGDIHIQKKNFSFYFPITTSIIVSIVLTMIFTLVSRK